MSAYAKVRLIYEHYFIIVQTVLSVVVDVVEASVKKKVFH